MKKIAISLLFLTLVSVLASTAQAEVKGAGATFPSAVYETWIRAYEKEFGVKVSYQPTGSGDGLKRIIARQVQFGGSDIAMSEADLIKHKLVQIPMLVGGVVPVVNLAGVRSNELRLTGDVLADIMLGNISKWNDPKIAALNPRMPLPAKAIVRVVRADRSGTSEGFTRYLALVSTAFQQRIGASAQPKWINDATLVAAPGNDGVVKALLGTPGAISYVSYDRVLNAGLSGVRLQSGDTSSFVAASEETFRQAVRSSKMQSDGVETASLINLPHANAWPITLTTYVLMDASPRKNTDVNDALQFLYWTQLLGDKLVRNTGFAPLPLRVQATFAGRFSKITPQDRSIVKLF